MPQPAVRSNNQAMNRIIELHDTEVVGITTVGNQVIVFLDAYVHESEGRPGRDPGTGWGQAAVLLFKQGTIEGKLPEPPVDIKSGSLFLGETESANLIPIPLDHIGAVTFSIRVIGDDGTYQGLKIRGAAVLLTLIGEPVYGGEFPPKSP